eukprot:6597360-Prymnesium_polylepis.1
MKILYTQRAVRTALSQHSRSQRHLTTEAGARADCASAAAATLVATGNPLERAYALEVGSREGKCPL